MQNRTGFALIARLAIENPRRPPAEVLYEMLQASVSVTALARALDVERATVRAALRAFGLANDPLTPEEFVAVVKKGMEQARTRGPQTPRRSRRWEKVTGPDGKTVMRRRPVAEKKERGA